MKKINCVCPNCNKTFEKNINYYKWNVSHGLNSFCSLKCAGEYKKKRVNANCQNCNCTICVRWADFEKSLNKHFFCSKSCAATFNNKHRDGHSEATKNRIRDGVLKHYGINIDEWKQKQEVKECERLKRKEDRRKAIHEPKKIIAKKENPERFCDVCGSKIIYSRGRKKDARWCSIKCYNVLAFGANQYTKEEVINKIVELFELEGVAPSNRSVDRKLVRAAISFFSSWRKAAECAGIKPNDSKYKTTRLCAKDGHVTDSISERIVDNTLTDNGWVHEKNKPYVNRTSHINCDFYITEYDLWVEYFGLTGNKWYDETTQRKIEFARKNNMKLVCLFPSDLYPKNLVAERIENEISRLKVKN